MSGCGTEGKKGIWRLSGGVAEPPPPATFVQAFGLKHSAPRAAVKAPRRVLTLTPAHRCSMSASGTSIVPDQKSFARWSAYAALWLLRIRSVTRSRVTV